MRSIGVVHTFARTLANYNNSQLQGSQRDVMIDNHDADGCGDEWAEARDEDTLIRGESNALSGSVANGRQSTCSDTHRHVPNDDELASVCLDLDWNQ